MKDAIIGWMAGLLCGIALCLCAIDEGNFEPIEKNTAGMYLTHEGKLYKLAEVACE